MPVRKNGKRYQTSQKKGNRKTNKKQLVSDLKESGEPFPKERAQQKWNEMQDFQRKIVEDELNNAFKEGLGAAIKQMRAGMKEFVQSLSLTYVDYN